MQSQSTVVRPQVVVIRERTANCNMTLVCGALAMLMAIVAAITLTIGLNIYCDGEYYRCPDKRKSNITAGSCFVVAAVLFLVCATIPHNEMREAARLNQSNPPQQPVTVSPDGQPTFALTTTSQQYPTSYAPPTRPAP